MYKGKRVFVSGGSGVIGRELVQQLYNAGAMIFVGDLKPRPEEWPADILYRQGDLNYITKEELDSFKPEYFFHLAATFERSTESYEFWEENYHHNVNLSHYLMDCLKDSQFLKKVIFASSYLIYDPKQYSFQNPAQKPVSLKETDPVYPRNLCGVAKFSHEIELRFLNEFRGSQFGSVSARIYRSYGKKSRDVISRWIRALLKGEELTVFKKEGIFDYIYAGDVAEGLMRLALSPAVGIYNLGSGNARRVEEVLEVLRGYFPEMKTREIDSDIPYEASEACMESFEKATGWMPERQLEAVIPELIEYEKQYPFTEEESAKINVLITSISKKVPMIKAVKRASFKLGNIGKVFGGDINKECLGKYFVDYFWEMPKLTDLPVDELVSFCESNYISCIIPSRDGELEYFARNKKYLQSKGIQVMVSGLEAVEACLDKLLFYEKATAMKLPAILTVQNIDEVNCYRYVVKERFGAGSLNIGVGLTREQALLHAANLSYPVFQPMVTGKEVSVDLYMDLKGRVKGVVARTRDLVIGGESQVTTTFRDKKIESLCTEFAKGFKLYGHVVMQLIVDNQGELNIIECNSRFGGASTLSLSAGLDSFYWFLLEALGVNIGPYDFFPTQTHKKQVRYSEDLII